MPEYKLQRFRDGWAACLYEGGKRLSRRKLRSSDEAGARAEIDRIINHVTQGETKTVRDLWEAYRKDREGRVIAQNMDYSGRAVLPFFGAMWPEQVTHEICRAYIASRRALGKQDGTIRTDLAHLRVALQWAYKTKRTGQKAVVELPPAAPPKDRYLTRDEAQRLMDAAMMPHVRLFILLGLSTAGRAAALLDLTWDRVDFDRGMIYLGDKDATRPRKGRASVPMTDDLRTALLDARSQARTDHVIEWTGSRIQKIRKGVEAAAKRAGLTEVSPHVLRHTAAVWMAEAGVSMAQIARVLGHSDSAITERVYASFSPDYLRGAVQHLNITGIRIVK